MFFTYTPRTVLLTVAVFFFLIYLAVFRIRTALCIVVLSLLLIYDSPWGGGTQPAPTDGLTLLSFNTHYASGTEIAALCKEHHVDLLSLQEVRSNNQEDFVAAFEDKYHFFAPDRNADFKYKEPYVFSCLIGIRRELLASAPEDVEIYTAITGYRTMAVRAALASGPLCLINVHTTKPIASGYGKKFLVKVTPSKAAMHREEHRELRSWLDQYGDMPVVIAGDFNAPANTGNLRFPGFKNAQRECGEGFHLTFPAKYPIFGIDHVLGNDGVELYSYEVLETGHSDHRAQVAKFRILARRASE